MTVPMVCVPCIDRYSMPSGTRTRNSVVDVFCSALREINKIKLLVSGQFTEEP